MIGSRWTGLLQWQDKDLVAVAHAQPVLCNLEHPPQLDQKVMIYDAKISGHGDVAQLCIDDFSKVVHLPLDGQISPNSVKEVCAGICGISMGLAACGFTRVASMDINGYMCDAQRSNGMHNVICGDILQPMDRWLLHTTPEPCRGTLACGFPCQPLSTQGDRKGALDSRAQPFKALMKMMWEQQHCAALFECVPGALSAPYIQTAIQQLGWSMGMHFAQRVLHLHDTWPCRRSRWWMIMIPTRYELHGLLALPADSGLCHFGHLFVTMPQWTLQETKELEVTEEEMVMFQDERYGIDDRLLHANKPVPCILHSYGSALTKCPCGCRKGGFLQSRLLADGLRGFFVIDSTTQKYRYLHVREAALLCGIDPQFNFGSSARNGLCLVGQCASPLQAFWMGLHLRQAFFGDVTPTMQELTLMKRFLLRQAYGAWQANGLQRVQICDHDGVEWKAPYDFVSQSRPTVEDFLKAEQRLEAHGQVLQCFDEYGKLAAQYKIGPGALSGPVVLCRKTKKRKVDTPQGHIDFRIAYIEKDGVYFHHGQLQPGSYVFEAFQQFDIWVGLSGIGDDKETVYRADDRLWQDTVFLTYDTRRGTTLHGCGDQATSRGLDSTIINNQVVKQLSEAKPTPFVWLDAEIGTAMILSEELDDDQRYIITTAYWKTLVTALAMNNHWTLITISFTGRTMHIHLWDGLDWISQEAIYLFAHKVKQSMDIRESVIYLDRVFDQTFPSTCGTICLLHMGYLLALWSEQDAPTEPEWHEKLLQHRDVNAALRACGKGGSSDSAIQEGEQELTWRLRDLLRDKGVPEDHTEERVLAAIKKIGADKLAEAMQTKNPWNSLKALGSQPRLHFLWIKPDELEKQIRVRAASKFQISKSHQKTGNGRSKRLDMVLDPTLLELLPNSFLTEQKEPVRQLSMAEVGSERAGLAFGAVADVLPFLREGKSLTTDAMAVLTTAPVPPESHGLLPVIQLRYPAKYTPTGEPVLIDGSLIQLGDVSVVKVMHQGTTDPSPIKTATLKVSIYKDEWEYSWTEFLESPVKQIMQVFPKFTMCRGQRCGGQCPKFHPPVDVDLDSVVVDVWSRSWQTLKGKRVLAKEADQFQVLLRVPAICEMMLQKLSGCGGMYVEPRMDDGKLPSPEVSVIWLDAATKDEAILKSKTLDRVLAIARFGSKFGVRVAQRDAETTHSQLHPDTPFHGFSIQKVFEVRPLPHGTMRTGVIQLLKSWQWKAKPLQPFKSDSSGMGWLIGTDEDPPAAVLPTSRGEVTATIHREAGKETNHPLILTSTKTRSHMRKAPQKAQEVDRSKNKASSSKTDPDPWWGSGRDPWGGYQTVFDGTGDVAMQAPSKLDAVEARLQTALETSVTGKVQQANEERFNRLEVDMAEIKAQNQQYQGWFHEAAQASNRMQLQVDELQTVAQAQATDMEIVKADISTVRGEIQSGFSNIEALLSKRPRN